MSAETTIDAFHRGRFFLVQPKKGHRSGMDAMMLAGLVPSDFCGRVVDLGAGAGAAGLAVASRVKKADVTLVEKSDYMVAYAKQTLSLPDNQLLYPRLSLLHADVELTGKKRVHAGLFDGSCDFAIMNPPFNPAHDRMTPDEVKALAHVMEPDMFEKWLRTAAAIVRPGGFVGLIARPQSISDILMAMHGRFGGLRLIPLHSRPHAAAIRILIFGKRASRAALSIEPPIFIHDDNGDKFSVRADAINNGQIGIWEQ